MARRNVGRHISKTAAKIDRLLSGFDRLARREQNCGQGKGQIAGGRDLIAYILPAARPGYLLDQTSQQLRGGLQ